MSSIPRDWPRNTTLSQQAPENVGEKSSVSWLDSTLTMAAAGATTAGEGDRKIRIEKDTMGYVEVPWEKYWGAQTQRSLVRLSLSLFLDLSLYLSVPVSVSLHLSLYLLSWNRKISKLVSRRCPLRSSTPWRS
jgi:hypothetical protein